MHRFIYGVHCLCPIHCGLYIIWYRANRSFYVNQFRNLILRIDIFRVEWNQKEPFHCFVNQIRFNTTHFGIIWFYSFVILLLYDFIWFNSACRIACTPYSIAQTELRMNHISCPINYLINNSTNQSNSFLTNSMQRLHILGSPGRLKLRWSHSSRI